MARSFRFSRFALPVTLLLSTALVPATPALAEDFNLPGLSDTVQVYEDRYGVPTIKGSSEADVAYVQGYIHARDRFFQMDFNRKTAQGRVSELVGDAGMANDLQLRTLGLDRAALVTWQALDVETKGIMQAYANGVNSWLHTNSLPPEYAVLELSRADPWTPLDSLSYYKLLALSLSFDLDEIDFTIQLGTYAAFGAALGFDGVALFAFDTYRLQPTDGRVTVPGFLPGIGGVGQQQTEAVSAGAKTHTDSGLALGGQVSDKTMELAQIVHENFSRTPLLESFLKPQKYDKGSNEWAVSGDYTDSGFPLVSNDPHLALDTPATLHESNLVYDMGEESYSVSGVQFAGAAGIIQGCNDRICWGSTVHPMDVNDTFQDLLLKNALGLPTHTVHNGIAEPLTQVYQSWFVNVVGDGVPDNLVRANVGIDAGGVTFVSPRRNNGPALALSGDTALFTQYTGWGPTFEPVFIRAINKARNMDEFKAGLQYFDFGSQNWIYGDVDGNIAYFTSGEKPLRADLAAGTVDGGVFPWFIRDGSGTLNHEWLPVSNPQPAQALRFEILPYNEMPQVVNPEWGYIANSNNDPVGVTLDGNPVNQLRPGGNGLYYLNYGYADFRQGRVDRSLQGMVSADKPITPEDMMILQANNQLLDAELTLPTLLGIMSQVPVPPGSAMADALNVLSAWNYSTPTGLAEGWDAGDDPNTAVEPDATEIRHSAAATVFALWRSMLIRNTIDATLTAVGLGNNLPPANSAHRGFVHLLLNYSTNSGIGASGLNFFSQGLPETVAGSLQMALDSLASDEYAAAFANSTNVLDYRWGKLHRIVFDHPLGVDPFNIPNGGSFGFTDLSPELKGLARQGGFEAVDASSHNARANSLNGFMFGSGPNRRFVGEMTPDGVIGYETIPGGQSGVFYHPNYDSQLPLWLTNSYHDLALGEMDGADSAVAMYTFGPLQ